MPNAVETYIAAWSEPDAAARARMIEACFAADGRLVSPNREIRGPAALTEEMNRFLADPQILSVRATSLVDVRGRLFRFRAAVDRRDGTSIESFDAGELDSAGQIAVLLAFPGTLS